MTYYVSSGTLNPTHSLTHFLLEDYCKTICYQPPVVERRLMIYSIVFVCLSVSVCKQDISKTNLWIVIAKFIADTSYISKCCIAEQRSKDFVARYRSCDNIFRKCV